MRRDFMSVKSLIESHALLHQATRARDASGNIIATLTDYTAIRDLISDLIAEGQAITVKSTVRETVEAVRELTALGGTASVRSIAAQLRLDESAAGRRCLEAARLGYLSNSETVPRRKARYVTADAMPSDTGVLPTVQAIARYMSGEGECPPTPSDFACRPADLAVGKSVAESEGSEGDTPPAEPGVGKSVAESERSEGDTPPSGTTYESDRFEEIAARLEFDEGMSRSEAEEMAGMLMRI